jgi:hypothetical protein
MAGRSQWQKRGLDKGLSASKGLLLLWHRWRRGRTLHILPGLRVWVIGAAAAEEEYSGHQCGDHHKDWSHVGRPAIYAARHIGIEAVGIMGFLGGLSSFDA